MHRRLSDLASSSSSSSNSLHRIRFRFLQSLLTKATMRSGNRKVGSEEAERESRSQTGLLRRVLGMFRALTRHSKSVMARHRLPQQLQRDNRLRSVGRQLLKVVPPDQQQQRVGRTEMSRWTTHNLRHHTKRPAVQHRNLRRRNPKMSRRCTHVVIVVCMHRTAWSVVIRHHAKNGSATVKWLHRGPIS